MLCLAVDCARVPCGWFVIFDLVGKSRSFCSMWYLDLGVTGGHVKSGGFCLESGMENVQSKMVALPLWTPLNLFNNCCLIVCQFANKILTKNEYWVQNWKELTYLSLIKIDYIYLSVSTCPAKEGTRDWLLPLMVPSLVPLPHHNST